MYYFIELTQPQGDRIWMNIAHIVSFAPAKEGGTFIDTLNANRGKIVKDSPEKVRGAIMDAMKGY